MLKKHKKKFIWITVILILALMAGVGVWRFTSKKAVVYETVPVIEGPIKQTVSLTGKVKASEILSLTFEKTGKIASIPVEVGQKVQENDILAELENAELLAEKQKIIAGIQSANATFLEHQADLDYQNVRLSEILSGERPESIQIYATKVQTAKIAFSDAKKNLTDTKTMAGSEQKKAEQSLIDSQTKLQTVIDKNATDLANASIGVKDTLYDAAARLENAVKAKINDLFRNRETSSPELSFTTTNNSAKSMVESRLIFDADFAVLEMQKKAADLSSQSTENDFDFALIKSLAFMDTGRELLSQISLALDDAIGLSSSTLGGYRDKISLAFGDINTAASQISAKQQSIAAQKTINANTLAVAQNEVNLAISTLSLTLTSNQSKITAAETKINETENALLSAENELALKTAGPTSQEIDLQKARIRQTEANIASQRAVIAQNQAQLANIEVQLEKATMKSPFSGLITKIDKKKGEIVAPNDAVISLISDAEFEIESNIPEVDIATIRIGQNASVTLDAYGNDIVFPAIVIKIDPAETIIENVPTYSTTLHFVEKDERIRSGMTANIDIITGEKDSALLIPQRAVYYRGAERFVRILGIAQKNLRIPLEIKVTTGLRGESGEIEILSSLKKDDPVILFFEEE